jgi:hypothetical protein
LYHIFGKFHLASRLLDWSGGGGMYANRVWLGGMWRFASHGQAELRRVDGAAAAEAEFGERIRHVGVCSLRDAHALLDDDARQRVRQPLAGDARDGRRHGPVAEAAAPPAPKLLVYAELYDLCAAAGPYDYRAFVNAGYRAGVETLETREDVLMHEQGVRHTEHSLHRLFIHLPPMALWALFPIAVIAQTTGPISGAHGVFAAGLAASLAAALLQSPRAVRFAQFCTAVAPLQYLTDAADGARHAMPRYVAAYFAVPPELLLRHVIAPAVLPPMLLRDHVAPLCGAGEVDTTALSVEECAELLAMVR